MEENWRAFALGFVSSIAAGIALAVLTRFLQTGWWDRIVLAIFRGPIQRVLEESRSDVARLEQELNSMRGENSDLRKELERRIPIRVDPRLDAYSINLDLQTPQDVRDRDHHWTSVRFAANIDRRGNYRATYSREGFRITPGITKEIRLQTGASFPVEFHELDVTARSLITGRPLLVQEDQEYNVTDKYKKKYSILMDPVVKQGEPVRIEWQFGWPHCVASKFDSDTINVAVFKKDSVDLVECELTFPYEIGRALMQELKGRQISDSATQPTVAQRGDLWICSWSMVRPRVDGYVLSWMVPEPTDKNDL